MKSFLKTLIRSFRDLLLEIIDIAYKTTIVVLTLLILFLLFADTGVENNNKEDHIYKANSMLIERDVSC